MNTKDLCENEVIGIYFSAHWCPPCRGFTPVLAETYETLAKAGKKFEIVFVSVIEMIPVSRITTRRCL